MNRDWLPVQLPESQARIKTLENGCLMSCVIFTKWTNSTYFSAWRTYKNQSTDSSWIKIDDENRSYHAKALDKIGSSYFIEEIDDFYYGKGSSYPDITVR
jgi:hypothetical protein